jgi:hypothetical protein
MDLRRVAALCATGVLCIAGGPKTSNAVFVDVSAPDDRPAVSMATMIPHVAYTFTINVEMMETVIGVDATFTAINNDMFQIHPDVDMNGTPETTTFSNLNASFPVGFSGDDDSQFEVIPAVTWDFAIPTVDPLAIPPSPDTSRFLGAGLADDPNTGFPGPKTTNFDLAHVVIPATSGGFYSITVVLEGGDPDGIPFTGTFGMVPIPESSQVIAGTVLTLGVLGVYIVKRRFSKCTVPT